MDVLKRIEDIGVIPVIKLEQPEDAVLLAEALCRGGLPVAEVTFRAAGAEKAIKHMAEQVPDILVGAGTVLTIPQADAAIDAGAKFIVSPGLNPKVVKHVMSRGIPMVPGCMTPSEIEQALELGLKIVKFFPAEAMGGLKTIKALAGPYGEIRFIPTGGITEENLQDYLKSSLVVACGGSWMVKAESIKNHDFDEIERCCKLAAEKKGAVKWGK